MPKIIFQSSIALRCHLTSSLVLHKNYCVLESTLKKILKGSFLASSLFNFQGAASLPLYGVLEYSTTLLPRCQEKNSCFFKLFSVFDNPAGCARNRVSVFPYILSTIPCGGGDLYHHGLRCFRVSCAAPRFSPAGNRLRT